MSAGAPPDDAAWLRAHLLRQCRAHDLFAPGVEPRPHDDLVESGHIDSMGLMTLQHLLEEIYGVSVTAPEFLAQFRTLERLAAHLEATMPAAAREALHAARNPTREEPK